ncbi:phosphoglycerate kinase [Halanaerobium saccharolyticum]|uniref:Phosphoglycerate kinase n=1 Tax=Halanaerobium saccharolyticum TaxID=43595 RepID=A0A4R7YXB8_9FIRM|nr:phosphoglycerate kinase [Halanaerobium saccharolyticum]RAK08946.1 phosphoglycerate kinase [Halanaerobium saccharolyticum]TDW02660.1 phosphoglycerate kinase [Halanaerobium saccharolyticum]TDX60709.1 phosphoglycerate kinase [Halanaerobium saccharolyticum]
MKKTLKDMDFKGKKVLVRVDFNVPLKEGVVGDKTRIRAALPTIEYLIKEDAKVLLISHLGRPGGEAKDDLRMDPVAKALANLLNKEVKKADDCIGKEVKKAVNSLENGEVMLLENSRFHAGEKQNDPEFAKELASLADLYVNDAFGAAHRAHATTVGVTEYLPAAAGFLMQRELNALGEVMENPESPFVAIMGGAKVSDKIDVIKNLITKVDKLIVAGGIANTFLLAKGYEVGDSLVEADKVDLAKELMEEAEAKGVEIVLPIDVVIADDFSNDANTKTVSVKDVPAGWQILDCGGPQSLEKYKEIIKNAKTVIWNGPLGVFEMEKFAKGTVELAKALAESDAHSVIGGGDSAAAINEAGVADKMSHISTGGGASLMFFEGKELPGVAALDDTE